MSEIYDRTNIRLVYRDEEKLGLFRQVGRSRRGSLLGMIRFSAWPQDREELVADLHSSELIVITLDLSADDVAKVLEETPLARVYSIRALPIDDLGGSCRLRGTFKTMVTDGRHLRSFLVPSRLNCYWLADDVYQAAANWREPKKDLDSIKIYLRRHSATEASHLHSYPNEPELRLITHKALDGNSEIREYCYQYLLGTLLLSEGNEFLFYVMALLARFCPDLKADLKKSHSSLLSASLSQSNLEAHVNLLRAFVGSRTGAVSSVDTRYVELAYKGAFFEKACLFARLALSGQWNEMDRMIQVLQSRDGAPAKGIGYIALRLLWVVDNDATTRLAELLRRSQCLGKDEELAFANMQQRPLMERLKSEDREYEETWKG